MTATTTPYPSTKFHSIDELCELVRKATDGWDTKWYRGAKSPTYSLLPKLFRDEELAKREGYISVEFRRRCRSRLSGVSSSFEWLCAMQHYGLPTRLLDWSESLSVALYFTCRPIGIDLVAPTIWVLNPFELYGFAENSSPDAIPIADFPSVRANTDLAFSDILLESLKPTKIPVPVVPDFLFDRLAIQNGAFTIHGTAQQPLENLIPPERREMLHKFVASNDALDKIYDALDLLIPSSDSMFPDIEGIKEYIV